MDKNQNTTGAATDCAKVKDYGHNGMNEDGTFTMHPSGNRVSKEEMQRRLPPLRPLKNDCMGMSWDEIERKQGGKLNRDI